MGIKPVSLLTFLSVSAALMISPPAQAGFDWIPGQGNNKGQSQSVSSNGGVALPDMGDYEQVNSGAHHIPEIYIKREKISPRDARAELEKDDYDEITLMNALIMEDGMQNPQATPMVMQSHPDHGPVQIVPVRPNYGANSSHVSMNAPEIIIEDMSAPTAKAPSKSHVASVSKPVSTAATYSDYRAQHNFVQNSSIAKHSTQPLETMPMQDPAPIAGAHMSEAPMLVADEPLALIMKATPAPQKTAANAPANAMTYVADPYEKPVALPAPSDNLSINPYPKAGLDMPESITVRSLDQLNTAPAPATPTRATSMATVSGFGNDLPLVIALQQIVPPDYNYQFGNGVDLGKTASWSGGKSWDIVLQNMLTDLGLRARSSGKTIRIEPNDNRV